MATEQKPERQRTKKRETTPAPAKINGKRKIKNDDLPEKVPISQSSTSNLHNHKSNGAKSISKSKLSEKEEQVAGEVDVVDRNLQVSPATNGIDASKKKKKKEKTKKDVKEGNNVVDVNVQVSTATNDIDSLKKKEVKEGNNQKKMKEDVKEKDDSLLYQIPMSRVSRIIKSEDPNVRISQEAVYIINKASENFLQVFTTEAYASAFLDQKKYIDYKHLSSVVSKRRRFDFLSDFVPEKVKAEDALAESQVVGNEIDL